MLVQTLMQTAQATYSHNFEPYEGELYGLCANENYLVFKWHDQRARILFSVCRRGNAASIHYAHDKEGRKYISKAVDEFISFVYWLFPWCVMIIGCISHPSAEKLAIKKGFEHIADSGKYKIYMRLKDGRHS